MTAGLAALSDLTVDVRCVADATHRLRWRAGELITLDHPNAERERALAALGADPHPCLQLIDAWHRHCADLDVLVLASRGGLDPVLPSDEPGQPHFVGLSRGRRKGWVARTGFTSYGSASYGPHASRLSFTTTESGGTAAGLDDLLRMGRRLSDRLVATIVDSWSQRLADGNDQARSARPALHAALYSRVAPIVRAWLGQPTLEVEVRLCEADGDRSIAAAPHGVVVTLPVSWLVEVWAAGLAEVADHFCLTASLESGGWTLDCVGVDLAAPKTLRLDLVG